MGFRDRLLPAPTLRFRAERVHQFIPQVKVANKDKNDESVNMVNTCRCDNSKVVSPRPANYSYSCQRNHTLLITTHSAISNLKPN